MKRGAQQREWRAKNGQQLLVWLDLLEGTDLAEITFLDVLTVMAVRRRTVPASTQVWELTDDQLQRLLDGAD
jgi:hypothetical protein